jgi:hypothetical protein
MPVFESTASDIYEPDSGGEQSPVSINRHRMVVTVAHSSFAALETYVNQVIEALAVLRHTLEQLPGMDLHPSNPADSAP